MSEETQGKLRTLQLPRPSPKESFGQVGDEKRKNNQAFNPDFLAVPLYPAQRLLKVCYQVFDSLDANRDSDHSRCDAVFFQLLVLHEHVR